MKKLILCLPILFLFMSGCTQDSIVKSTALRSVIDQYDAQQPSDRSIEERKKTIVEVEKVEMLSENEAKVDVRIHSPSENKIVPVHLIKKDRWAVAP